MKRQAKYENVNKINEEGEPFASRIDGSVAPSMLRSGYSSSLQISNQKWVEDWGDSGITDMVRSSNCQNPLPLKK